MSDKLVTVAEFADPMQAHLARAAIEAEDIRCAIVDEHMAGMISIFTAAIGGAKLQVAELDAQRALEILDQCEQRRQLDTHDDPDDADD